MDFLSPNRIGITSSIRIISFSFEIFSNTLSMATCVDAHNNIFFFLEINCAINSHKTVVLPEPGGPSRNAKSFVFNAILTNSRCSSIPFLSSSLSMNHCSIYSS